MSKATPPFNAGSLVKTRNDSTFLGHTHYENLGTSTHGIHESYQYPAGTVLMVVDMDRIAGKGWKVSFMTPDRGVLQSGCDSRRSWLRLMDTIE